MRLGSGGDSWTRWGKFAEHGFALLDAGGLQSIDEFEQLPLPAHELGAGLPTATIVKGHRS